MLGQIGSVYTDMAQNGTSVAAIGMVWRELAMPPIYAGTRDADAIDGAASLSDRVENGPDKAIRYGSIRAESPRRQSHPG